MRKSVALVIASLAAGVAATRVHGRPTAHAVTAPFGQLPVMDYNTWYQDGAGATEGQVLQQARIW